MELEIVVAMGGIIGMAVGWPTGKALAVWLRTGQEPPTWLVVAFGSAVGLLLSLLSLLL